MNLNEKKKVNLHHDLPGPYTYELLVRWRCFDKLSMALHYHQ